MIVNNKFNCCGCSACAQVCPQHCITMQEDKQGFLYPAVKKDDCINCRLCEKVCPYENAVEVKKPLLIKTAINPDFEVRIKSSSGGVFTMLALQILKDNGVVFGSRFNDHWEVIIDYTESIEGLISFRGSKYVQSTVGNAYIKAQSFLQEGRQVLFSGTPCQIAGLRLFLRKEYDNLLTVSIACHSVPSPLVWREYLNSLKIGKIIDINFRDKHINWEQYGIRILNSSGRVFFQKHGLNPYMQLFLHSITTRPSCFNCPAKDEKSSADIIIGDCWGISQMIPLLSNDHKGISFVICNSTKGVKTIMETGIEGEPLTYEKVIANNSGLTTVAIMPKERESFWNSFIKQGNKRKIINRFAKRYLPGLRSIMRGLYKHLINT